MHTLEQLETKQVGLRLSTYLVDEVDEFIEDFNINRSTFIAEAIRNFLQEQKEKRFYDNLEESVKEMKMMMDGEIPKISARDTIQELRDECKDI